MCILDEPSHISDLPGGFLSDLPGSFLHEREQRVS
jgi:hypothetical protein